MNITPQVIDHGQGILQIDAQFIEPGMACVYLLRQGNRLAIIETGTQLTASIVLQVIEGIGLSPEHLDWVIPTHIHLDHAAGAGHLMAACPNAKLVIHPNGAEHMRSPQRLQESSITVYGEEFFHRVYGELIPIEAEKMLIVNDNDTIDFNGRTLSFLDTPGHALHHFCVYDSGSDSIFSGDTFGLSYRFFDSDDNRNFMFVTTTPTQLDPETLKESIIRLANCNPDRIYLTHYGPISPTFENVNQLLESIDAFVEIALNEEQPVVGRTLRIKNRIEKWLHQRMIDNNFPCTTNSARNRIADDALLNAKGLDVWLKRLENAQKKTNGSIPVYSDQGTTQSIF